MLKLHSKATTHHFTLSCLGRGYYVCVFAEEKKKPGVHAWVYLEGARCICLLADSPENKGVSATNNFEGYAKALCQEMRGTGVAIDRIQWYELDSMGRFDEVAIQQDAANFSALKVGGLMPSSKEAFLARMWQAAPASMEFWHHALSTMMPAERAA